MDVFRLRDAVVGEYREYVESFVRVLDPRLDGFVRRQLEQGELWPDAVLQLNPAFEPGATLDELGGRGVLRPETAACVGLAGSGRDGDGRAGRLNRLRRVHLVTDAKGPVVTV